MEDDSDRKHITFRVHVSIFSECDNFRSHIAGSPTTVEKIFLLVCVGSQPKINNNGVK